MILKILKFFIFVIFLCFLAMVIAELDAGWKNLQYVALMKVLNEIRVVEMKKYFGDKNEQDKSQSLFTL